MKLKTIVLIFAGTGMAISCTKIDTPNDHPYVKPSEYFMHMRKNIGAKSSILMEMGDAWHVVAPIPSPDWMIIERLTGQNSDSIIVTVTKENISAGNKMAVYSIVPDNNITLKPLKLTVIQYDSTYKGK